MQEANRDGLDAVIDEAAQRGPHRVEIDRYDDAARSVDAFRDFAAVAARHQRLGEFEEKIVDIVTLLGPHLETVAKPLGGQKPDRNAAALNDGVRHEGGAVDDLVDLIERDAGLAGQFAEAVERGERGIVRRRQALVERDAAALAVIEHEVGERAADIEADAIVRHLAIPPAHRRPIS